MLQPPALRREGRHERVALRFQEHLEIVLSRIGIGERETANHLAAGAHHGPVTDHLVHRFGERTRGREILQDIDALVLPDAFKYPALDFGEVDHRLTARILEADDIEAFDVPGGDVLGERERRGATRLEFEFHALRGCITLQRNDAGLAALCGRELPLADHVFLQGCRILRDGRMRTSQRRHQHRYREAPRRCCSDSEVRRFSRRHVYELRNKDISK
jgi:hypothetical protein